MSTMNFEKNYPAPLALQLEIGELAQRLYLQSEKLMAITTSPDGRAALNALVEMKKIRLGLRALLEEPAV